MSNSAVFKKALSLLESGKIDQSLDLLSSVTVHHQDGDLLHLKGAALARMENFQDAEVFFRAALKKQPNNFQLRCNLAKSLKLSGQAENAEQMYIQLHSDQPLDALVTNELASMALLRNDLTSAELYCNRALAVHPGYTPSIINLVAVYTLRGQFDQAMGKLNEAEDAESPLLLLQYGAVLLKASRFFEAREVFERLQDSPRFEQLDGVDVSRFYSSYGAALVELGEYEDGRKLYEKAGAGDCDDWLLLINQAHFNSKVAGDYDAAELLYKEALAKYPDIPEVNDFYAVFLQHMGRYEEALVYHQNALMLRPDCQEFLYNQSMTEMALGQLEKAWTHYESRWSRQEPWSLNDSTPHWQGESGKGKSILVYREQGLGDEIMWATCLPDLAGEFATVVYACHPKLVTLFSRSYPEIVVIPNRVPRHALMAQKYDYQVAIGSLPKFFRQSLSAFSGQSVLLQDDIIRTNHWRSRLQALEPGLLVGLAWRSGYRDAIRNHNYLDLLDLAPLFELSGVHLINLQHQLATEEQRWLDERFPGRLLCAHEIDLFDDLDAAACLMKACDLIVAPGTATYMQAAALGVPTIYLSSWAVDYWQLGCQPASPWFPAVTTLSKGLENSWGSLINQLCHIVSSLVDEKNHSSL
ncbi:MULTISPECIES: tetratricopeptide repeat protein [Deefgea]|uniref:Tetratricopeptide repeat protein n=1 Tax=Deefgea chitinilytica TaxID=570276 RepID=A0ABS2C9Q2_9NEIS|nr:MULTISPECIES: tetratricopeptide repeat protein [Deefgea]MBM5570879.1 tetratricopeptide repeat protein [Deefgea chitinilytica]MBM9888108.1 tetratricopeptide repeat protein [Deefgea sp. CFH1-16]